MLQQSLCMPNELISTVVLIISSVVMALALGRKEDAKTQINAVALSVAPCFVIGLIAAYYAQSDISAQPPDVASAQSRVSYAAVLLAWCAIMVVVAARIIVRRVDSFDRRLERAERTLSDSGVYVPGHHGGLESQSEDGMFLSDEEYWYYA